MNFDVWVSTYDLLSFILVTPQFVGEARLAKIARRWRRMGVWLRHVGRRKQVFGWRLNRLNPVPAVLAGLTLSVFGGYSLINGGFPPHAIWWAAVGIALNQVELFTISLKGISLLSNDRFRSKLFFMGCILFVLTRVESIAHSWRQPDPSDIRYDFNNVAVRLR